MNAAVARATRSPDRRRAILDAALRCFVEQGYAATTIDDILRGSGASVGSVYHHFGAKEGIAAALHLEALGDYQAGLLAVLDAARDAQSGIRAIPVYHLDWVRAHPQQARFLFAERPPEVEQASSEAQREMNRRTFGRVRAWLEREAEAGALRRVPHGLFYVILLGPSQELSRLWLAGRLRVDLRLAQRELGEAAWAALRA